MKIAHLDSFTSTPYLIKFFFDGINPPCYQLVRTLDLSVVVSYRQLGHLFAYCFEHDIVKSDVTLL